MIYDVVGKPDGQIAVLKEFAQHCYSLGEFSKGHQYHARALGLAESYDTTDLEAELWMIRGVALKEAACLKHPLTSLGEAPELHEALRAYEHSLSLLRNIDTSKQLESVILTNRGLLFYLLDDYNRAFGDLSGSLAIRTSLADEIGRATILNDLALIMINSAKPDDAKDCLDEALEIYRSFNHLLGQCQVLHDLGGVCMTRMRMVQLGLSSQRLAFPDEYRKAHRYFSDSLRLAEQLGARTKIRQAEHNLKRPEQVKAQGV